MPLPGPNNRDRVRDPREEILLETNFEDDGILTRAYNNNPYNSRRRATTYRSDPSLDRYTDHGGEGRIIKRIIITSYLSSRKLDFKIS